MTSELTLFVLRLAFLAVLWIFVFSIIYALRSDLFGTRASEYQRTLEQSRAQTFGAASDSGQPVVAAPVAAPVSASPASPASAASMPASAMPAPAARPTPGYGAGAELPTEAVTQQPAGQQQFGQQPAAQQPVHQQPVAQRFGGGPTTGGTAVTRQATRPSRLVITSGPRRGQEVNLGSRAITIGRHPESDLIIADDYSSTHHARLVPSGSVWSIHDLGSTNGTFVEGRRIDSPAQLAPGQPVRIGTTTFELRQ